jgi:hypothetical protein
MRHARVVTLVTALACGLAANAGAGTSLVKSWREPSAAPLKFAKVLVLVIAPHESQMQFGEAVLVGLMKRTQGVSAHAVMPKDDARDEQKMRAFMAQESFDGAVTMRLLAAGQETTAHAGIYVPAHTGFWNYYSYAWPLVTDIGYVHTERLFHMETQVYSMKDDKIVWAGISKTTDPKNARQLVEDVARTVAKDLKKQRLVE